MMKPYIYILLTILCFNLSFAQETIVPLSQLGVFNEAPNTIYYYKDINNDLDKFVGTWIYTNTNQEFTVTIFKVIHKENGGTFCDDIYAKIKFVNNGVTIYDSLNENGYHYNDISGANLDQNNLNRVGLIYREPSGIPVTSIPSVNLEYIPCTGLGCQPQLTWHNTYLKETPDEPWPFVIPVNMIVTKQ